MNVHAIQTGTVAVKQSQLNGGDRNRRNLLSVMADSRWTEPLAIYAWLIEHPEGMIVVDIGETARVSDPGYFPRWHPFFRFGVREWVEPEQEIGPQLRALGFSPDDVRWVVLTHFHTDHAGGLRNFPASELLATKTDYAQSRGSLGSARGFLPQRWPDWFAPKLIEHEDGPFESFAQSTTLTKAGDVHLIPTPGHTPGHMSVALEDREEVIVIAGDASYTEQNMVDGVTDGVSAAITAARDSLGAASAARGRAPDRLSPDPRSGLWRPARRPPDHQPTLTPIRQFTSRVEGARPNNARSNTATLIADLDLPAGTHQPERTDMIEFTIHVDIHRPPQQIFDFLLDFENAPKWNYYVTDVTKRSSGPIGLGTVFHQTRKTDQQDYQITDIDPGRSIEITTTAGSSPAFTRRLELEPAPTGTRLHDHWRLHTERHPLMERLATRQISTAVTENLGKLKGLLETGTTKLQDGRTTKP